MAYTEVLYEVRDRVAYITFNRPEKRNAMDQNSMRAMLEYLQTARESRDVWIIVISGKGKMFSAGQDINDLKDVDSSEKQIDCDQIYKAMRETCKPIISAINGLCLGAGSGMALAADVRFMATSARMCWSQAKIGIVSISGPTVLGRLVPPNIAMELLFTGDFLSAERAYQLGLVNHVVPDETLDEEVRKFVERVLANGPLAVRAMKETLLKTIDMPVNQAWEVAVATLGKLRRTHDAQEGLQAFLQKHAPVWTCT